MKKYFYFSNKFRPLYIILALIFLLSIACKIVVSYLSSNHVYFYFNRIVNDEIQQHLLRTLFIALGIFLVITLKIDAQKILAATVCVFCYFVISIFSIELFFEAEKSYFEFESPYNKTIIVEECSWLLGGWSNVYQKTSSNIICELDGYISTDDGYRPFSNNDFNLDWTIDSVNITYGYGSRKIQKNEVYKLK